MISKFQTKECLVRWTFSGLAALMLAGCGRDDTKVYRVAKDSSDSTPAAPAMQTPPGMGAPAAGDQTAAPQLTWTLPAGWQEKPASEMRLASFSAPGAGGKSVDISIVPLPGMAGGDLANVNRWRGQVGLDPIQDGDLAKAGEDVTVGDSPARLYDMAGNPPGGDGKSRILAVALQHSDMMWFFKATGDDDSVGQQKANFVSFLKSIQFAAGTMAGALPSDHPPIDAANTLPADHPAIDAGMAAPGMTAQNSGAPALPNWTVPAAWQQEPPSQMLLAKFSAAENGAKAEITVSAFPGDVGGLLANVNRWRRQVGLPPVDDASLNSAVTAFTTAAGPASMTDFTGTDPKSSQSARLMGVILPLGGQTWFYKLMGDPTVVEHQKADFLNFVQSVKY